MPETKKPTPKQKIIMTLSKKRVFIPIYTLVGLLIVYLLLLPFFPQVQSKAQKVTARHPALAAIAPPAFKPPDVSLPDTGNWLVIPAVGIKMPINEGADISVLDDTIGVWHQTGETSDNYVIAGHKLQYSRSVNQSLYDMHTLKDGDGGVYVIIDGQATEYKVYRSEIIEPTSVEILKATGRKQLTIYTCNDFFNKKRYVIQALPV